ncbi:MAG: hypothetical protein ABJC04_07080 [Verrucomicrobiota bacterium]
MKPNRFQFFSFTKKSSYRFAAALTGVMLGARIVSAATVTVPNFSFETPLAPPIPGAIPFIDYWEENPKPPEYTGTGQFDWENLAGVFLNTPEGASDHIDNLEGSQALYLFAVPKLGIFQDYDAVDYNPATPLNQFTNTYTVGQSYRCAFGVLGNNANMQAGVPLLLGLYYRETTNKILIASNIVLNSSTLFPTNTHFTDFNVDLPVVKPSDAWAGKHIGIQILSTVSDEMQGGYWDLDNVRLISVAPPQLMFPGLTNGNFTATIQGEIGFKYEVLASTNIAMPLTNWTSITTITNTSGAEAFVDAAPGLTQRFYSVRQLP